MRRRRAVYFAMIACLAAAGWAGGCGSARRDEPFTQPLKISDSKLAWGQRIFADNCDECHNGGAGGYGPPLNDRPLPTVYIQIRVRHGLGAMPAFDGSLISDNQLDALIDYIHSLHGLGG